MSPKLRCARERITVTDGFSAPFPGGRAGCSLDGLAGVGRQPLREHEMRAAE